MLKEWHIHYVKLTCFLFLSLALCISKQIYFPSSYLFILKRKRLSQIFENTSFRPKKKSNNFKFSSTKTRYFRRKGWLKFFSRIVMYGMQLFRHKSGGGDVALISDARCPASFFAFPLSFSLFRCSSAELCAILSLSLPLYFTFSNPTRSRN